MINKKSNLTRSGVERRERDEGEAKEGKIRK